MKKPILILCNLIVFVTASRLPEDDIIKSVSIPVDSILREEPTLTKPEVSSESLIAESTRSFRKIVGELLSDTFYTVMEALSKSLSDLSARSRFRRELNSSENSLGDEDTDYIFHSLSVGVGAFMDKQSCRRRLTCQATKIVKRNVPGLEMLVMLVDNVVPDSWVDWFSTIKSSAVDRNDRCSMDYDCDILPNDE